MEHRGRGQRSLLLTVLALALLVCAAVVVVGWVTYEVQSGNIETYPRALNW